MFEKGIPGDSPGWLCPALQPWPARPGGRADRVGPLPGWV